MKTKPIPSSKHWSPDTAKEIPPQHIINELTKVSPGGIRSNLRAWEPYPLYFHRGEGARIRDVDNHEYLDYSAAQSVLLVGHRNPIVTDAVRQQ